jgi:hypothetical protein
MREIVFPSSACVLACSGPSLNTVDVFSLGLPVVVVSTAIRRIVNPNYWILADYVNEMHGEEGTAAYANSEIIKVVPSNKVSQNIEHRSMVLCEYDTATRWPNINELLFNKKEPFLRGPHKSVTFAIQWLHHIGVKTVIWAGNDLSASSMKEKYCYEVKEFDMKKEYNYQKTLDHTADALEKWYPIALKRGFQWYSWNCGEIFEKFVPKFDYSAWGEGKYQSYIDTSIKITVDDEYDIKKNRRPSIKERKKLNNEKIIVHNTPAAKIEIQKIKENLTTVIPHVMKQPDPSKEIVSERRQHLRNMMNVKKNLRSR